MADSRGADQPDQGAHQPERKNSLRLAQCPGRASARQQDAIDKNSPLLHELASSTEAIIGHLSDKKQTRNPGYQGYLKSNAELATDLSRLISDYIDYGGAKLKTQDLGRRWGSRALCLLVSFSKKKANGPCLMRGPLAC